MKNCITDEIPHGHGASYKKGVSDGLMDENAYENKLPNGHNLSYSKGKKVGIELKTIINSKIKR